MSLTRLCPVVPRPPATALVLSHDYIPLGVRFQLMNSGKTYSDHNIQLINSSMDHAFGVLCKPSPDPNWMSWLSLPSPRSLRLSMSSSGRFVVLHFPCGSVIHFGLLFGKGVRSVSRFSFFFAHGRPAVPSLLVEKTTLYFLCSLVACVLRVYFWALCPVPLIYVSTLWQSHVILIAVALQKVWWCRPPLLVSRRIIVVL